MMKKSNTIYFYCFAILVLFLNSCKKSSETSDARGLSDSNTGVGGSMARFTVVGNNLFAVNDKTLKVFDLSASYIPQYIGETNLGIGIETIFPYGKNLFIGSTTGMLIYDITVPNTPVRLSNYAHVYSCDPVVTDGKYAYITLRSGMNRCRRNFNRLEIVDVSNLNNPFMVAEYNMTNPKGLGVDDSLLFVCDDGLKVYNAKNVKKIFKIHQFSITAYDVIPLNGLLIVTGDNGLYQYRYSNDTITLLSTIKTEL